MWECSYIGDQLLSTDIHPSNENESDTPESKPTPDKRVSEFIDTLRARISAQDEAQRQSWLKQAKPASKRKHTPVVNPEWLKAPPKRGQSATKPAAAQNRPFGNSGKRPQRSSR
jgi:hypothetical protein